MDYTRINHEPLAAYWQAFLRETYNELDLVTCWPKVGVFTYVSAHVFKFHPPYRSFLAQQSDLHAAVRTNKYIVLCGGFRVMTKELRTNRVKQKVVFGPNVFRQVLHMHDLYNGASLVCRQTTDLPQNCLPQQGNPRPVLLVTAFWPHGIS